MRIKIKKIFLFSYWLDQIIYREYFDESSHGVVAEIRNVTRELTIFIHDFDQNNHSASESDYFLSNRKKTKFCFCWRLSLSLKVENLPKYDKIFVIQVNEIVRNLVLRVVGLGRAEAIACDMINQILHVTRHLGWLPTFAIQRKTWRKKKIIHLRIINCWNFSCFFFASHLILSFFSLWNLCKNLLAWFCSHERNDDVFLCAIWSNSMVNSSMMFDNETKSCVLNRSSSLAFFNLTKNNK